MASNNKPVNENSAKSNGLASFLETNPDISAAEIAKQLGLSQGFISQVKSGKRDLPISNALRLEILFGADAAELNKEIAEIRLLKPIPINKVSESIEPGMPT